MPTGIIINTLSIAIGGILGALIGGKLTEDLKDKLNMVFGVCVFPDLSLTKLLGVV